MAAKAFAVDGHALTLTETNNGGAIPLCECGWVGPVSLTGRRRDDIEHAGLTVWEVVCGLAAADHRSHLKRVREAARGMSDARAAEIVRRPGRFSHS